MRTALRMFALSMAILTLTASAARATHTVYAPNYPALSQLESGWNAAFVSWLAVQYGGTPVITSTTTYAGPDGQIFVVSSFTAGTINGRILGLAFDPQEATPVGDGSYSYQVKSTGLLPARQIRSRHAHTNRTNATIRTAAINGGARADTRRGQRAHPSH